MPTIVIASRFNVGVSIAFPAAVCINCRLYLLALPTSIIPSQANKNRELIIDFVIGIGLPIIIMVLCLSSNSSLYLFGSSIFSAFLVQTSRFMITEDFGCTIPILSTWVSLIIISIPLILLELIAGVYGCLSIHAFYNRSKQNETHNSLNSNRYTSFICFSACDLICGIPITLFYLYFNIMVLVPVPDSLA